MGADPRSYSAVERGIFAGIDQVECSCGCVIASVNGYWVRDALRCSAKHTEGVIMSDDALVSGTKPGWKTTEFWFSVAAFVVGAALSSGAIGAGTAAESVLGIVASALSALGYSVSRGLAKKTG